MMKITDAKGFQMTFANGWTVSVQWGWANYCDNADKVRGKISMQMLGMMNSRAGSNGCKTAEVAAWNSDGRWIKFPNGDTVCGYATADEVAKFISAVASFSKIGPTKYLTKETV